MEKFEDKSLGFCGEDWMDYIWWPVPEITQVAFLDIFNTQGFDGIREIENKSTKLIDNWSCNPSPEFKELKPGTNLNTPPNGWLIPKEYCSKSDPLVSSDESINGYHNLEKGLKEFTLSCLLDDNEECEQLPHFISSTTDMKSIFKLSHNE